MLIKFEPQNMDELSKLSVIACKSGLMPSYMTPEKFMIIAMKGAELGIPVLQAIHGINVINNKPAISAELMLALVYNRMPNSIINFIENTDIICTIHAQRRPTDKISEFTFSMIEAEKAGLLSKEPWKKYPAAMLRARCISAMCRAIFPDALMGASYTPEELGAEITIDENGQEEFTPQPEKSNREKWDELPEDIKIKFEALSEKPEIEPRINICAGLNFDVEKINNWLNKVQAKRNESGQTDEGKFFLLSEEIKQLFKELLFDDKKTIAFCKKWSWNEQVILFELKKEKSFMEKK